MLGNEVEMGNETETLPAKYLWYIMYSEYWVLINSIVQEQIPLVLYEVVAKGFRVIRDHLWS